MSITKNNKASRRNANRKHDHDNVHKHNRKHTIKEKIKKGNKEIQARGIDKQKRKEEEEKKKGNDQKTKPSVFRLSHNMTNTVTT